MTANDRCDALTERLRAGDEDAVIELVQRYTSRLIALARSRLEPLLRFQVDPEDVVQSVYKSLLKRLNAGDCQFDYWDDVWSYLVLLTVRKCWDRRHYHRATRRNIAREQPFAAADDQGEVLGVVARDPSPFEAAVLAELVERFLGERTPRDRGILTLHLQGFTIAEISERCGHAQRTVRRTIATAKHRLRDELRDDDPRQDERNATPPNKEHIDA